MDWSNRFTIGGFTVTYSLRGMWEVLEECSHHGAREASWRWFGTREQAETFCLMKLNHSPPPSPPPLSPPPPP